MNSRYAYEQAIVDNERLRMENAQLRAEKSRMQDILTAAYEYLKRTNCRSCKFELLGPYEDPCKDCRLSSGWVFKEE